MRRRSFIKRSSLLASGYTLRAALPAGSTGIFPHSDERRYALFKNPPMTSRPFVRWWWNGDKIEKPELARELRLLKDAGIGGVEINPIAFPDKTADMGIPAWSY